MSTEDTILVGGGTGMPGEQVARQLHRDGFEVRVLARDVERARTLLGPDFEYLAGDVDDRDAVESALEGCAGVHVSLRGASDPDELDRVEHWGTARVAELAAQQGVSRLTYLSGMLVAEDVKIPGDRTKYRAEQAIHQSGVPYTIFKPTYLYGDATETHPGQPGHRLGQPTPPAAHCRCERLRADGVPVIPYARGREPALLRPRTGSDHHPGRLAPVLLAG
jgi:uncharacterized protein YbjT (DUF2867 family)